MRCNKPVVIIFFNRPDKLKLVLEKVKLVKPNKLYLISDGPRKEKGKEEYEKVKECRSLADKYIDWDCKIIKKYEEENKGCYNQIAGGATWVFSKEEEAIFLEDDNIPDVSFFKFCEEMLDKYKEEKKVFWICGGNYLIDYKGISDSSYMFSNQMFPCGWASWRRAWEYYDGNITNWGDSKKKAYFLSKLQKRKIKNYKKYVLDRLYNQVNNSERLYTWDHQWQFNILINDGLVIVPKKNLINNIGIGEDSTHGGVILTKQLSKMVMLKANSLTFPLIHPVDQSVDYNFEKKIEDLIGGIPTIKYCGYKVKKTLKNIIR